MALLREREGSLAERIAADSEALAEVRARLRAVEDGHRATRGAVEEVALPAVDVVGVAETVRDETEIPGAVARLLAALGVDGGAPGSDVLLAFDGRTDPGVVVVRAAVVGAGGAADAAAVRLVLPAAATAVAVHLPELLASTADAWIALDDAAASRGLRTTGPFRQTLHANGGVTLATPVVPLAD
ncbi:hypothetical protein [Litorihabitans aurantiacus]|uniref:Uncharacterized protein n=1 Tax=Litorihabitans aurantiacus TaxID=1930061 RepID=A0AA37XGT6_9MICO|nr:hypothetical protein [Litorihabitans aurantiacus]GMA33121.1 hypothetical protein GCM10025875_31130 [Litorihabitans aurantiacus]